MADKDILDYTDETSPVRGNEYLEIQSASEGTRRISDRTLRGGGLVDYNDAATAGTPISPSTSTWTKMTNDKNGSFTNTSYLPIGVTDMWDTINNQFDFSQLSLGDRVMIRFDCSVTTNSANQIVRQRLQLDIGGSPYELEFSNKQFKTAGTYQIIAPLPFFIGSAGTRDNPAEWQIWTDGTLSVVVNGVYITVDRY